MTTKIYRLGYQEKKTGKIDFSASFYNTEAQDPNGSQTYKMAEQLNMERSQAEKDTHIWIVVTDWK